MDVGGPKGQLPMLSLCLENALTGEIASGAQERATVVIAKYIFFFMISFSRFYFYDELNAINPKE
tara:strand:+ start:428 stop:622 length:195 start_codon:yes stop_codon:yes gene_type:complete